MGFQQNKKDRIKFFLKRAAASNFNPIYCIFLIARDKRAALTN